MKTKPTTFLAMAIAILALAGTLLPPAIYLFGGMALPAVKTAMLISTIVWFVAASLWLLPQSDAE